MNNIIEVAKTRDAIMAKKSVTCPICGDSLFSIFDKLYITAYGKCVCCTEDGDLERLSENIFKIL